MKYVLKLCLLLTTLFSFALQAEQKPEDQIAKLFPKWTTHQLAKGDLNKDSLEDLAIIHFIKKEGTDDYNSISEITLRVFFSDASHKLNEIINAPRSVCANCGGVKGEQIPFGISIEKGTLHLSAEGGSRQMWSYKSIWRFQDAAFYLIGYNSDAMDTLAEKEGDLFSVHRDANISTLKMIETLESLKGKTPEELENRDSIKKETKCNVAASYKKIKLSDYDQENFESPKCTKASL